MFDVQKKNLVAVKRNHQGGIGAILKKKETDFHFRFASIDAGVNALPGRASGDVFVGWVGDFDTVGAARFKRRVVRELTEFHPGCCGKPHVRRGGNDLGCGGLEADARPDRGGGYALDSRKARHYNRASGG